MTLEDSYDVVEELLPLLEQLPRVDDYDDVEQKYRSLTGENDTAVGLDENHCTFYETAKPKGELIQTPYDEVLETLQNGERPTFELVDLDVHPISDIFTLCITLPEAQPPEETGVDDTLEHKTVFYHCKPLDMMHLFLSVFEDDSWVVFSYTEEHMPEDIRPLLDRIKQFNDDNTFNIDSANELQSTLAEAVNRL